MRITMLLLSLAFSVSISAQTDFSGKWKLNVEKSQFNETPGTPAAPRLFVEQKAGAITFQRNDRPKETFKLNKAEEIVVNEADYKTKVAMKSTADKKGMIETRTYIYPAGNKDVHATKKTRIWKLSDDKQTLIIKDHIETNGDRQFDMTLVYDRQ